MTLGECYTSQFNIKLQYLETTESLCNHLHLHGATQGYTEQLIYLFIMECQIAPAHCTNSSYLIS